MKINKLSNNSTDYFIYWAALITGIVCIPVSLVIETMGHTTDNGLGGAMLIVVLGPLVIFLGLLNIISSTVFLLTSLKNKRNPAWKVALSRLLVFVTVITIIAVLYF